MKKVNYNNDLIRRFYIDSNYWVKKSIKAIKINLKTIPTITIFKIND